MNAGPIYKDAAEEGSRNRADPPENQTDHRNLHLPARFLPNPLDPT
jgi:hypothetical protein